MTQFPMPPLPLNEVGLWAKTSPSAPHQTTSCLCWAFSQCSTALSFTTGVPNGIPGSGMCSRQSAERREAAGKAQGTYIKQGEPGSHTSWTRAQRSLPAVLGSRPTAR